MILAVILASSMAADALWESPPYVADWLTGNVFSANLATTERVRYSPAFEENFASRTAQQTQQQVAAPGPQSGRNVVIVILESWSSWHSRLFGGSEDWTPRLDDAAQLGLRFTDFHSIGFTTSNGLVGILAGQKIWSPFLHLLERSPFVTYCVTNSSLLLTSSDYRSA